jgi:hypothetical protein
MANCQSGLFLPSSLTPIPYLIPFVGIDPLLLLLSEGCTLPLRSAAHNGCGHGIDTTVAGLILSSTKSRTPTNFLIFCKQKA